MIQAIGLTSLPRRHQLKPTVDDLTFEARPGRVTVLLGPERSGKTTALRLMLQLQPGRGIALFRGRPVHRVPHLARELGVLLGEVPGHPARTSRGHLRMLAAAAGVPADRADDVLDVVGLSGLADQRMGTLSRGMDRRLGVACALLGDPHTLIMDEPAQGLSPRENNWLYSLLRGYAKQGGTVLVTSHLSEEAAALADRVVSIDSGRLIADQDAADFVRTRLRPRVAVRTPHAERLAAVLTEEARKVGSTGRESGPLKVVCESGSRVSVYGSSCAEVGEHVYRHGILVHQLTDERGEAGDSKTPTPLDRADGRSASQPSEASAISSPAAVDSEPPPGRSAAEGEPAEGDAEPASVTSRPDDADDPPVNSGLPAEPVISELPGCAPAATQAESSVRAPESVASDAGPDSGTTEPEAEQVPALVAASTSTSGSTSESAATDTITAPASSCATTSAYGTGTAHAPSTHASTAYPDSASAPSVMTSPEAPTVRISEGPLVDSSAPQSVVTKELSADAGSGKPRPPWTPTRTPERAAAELPPRMPALARPGPVAPLRYELRRLFSVRSTWFTLAAALVAALCFSLVLARTGIGLPPPSGSSAEPAVRLLTGWPSGGVFFLPPAAVAAALLGALAFGEEFRYPALAPARSPMPRTLGHLAAKLTVSASAAVALCLAVAALNAACVTLFFGSDALALPSSTSGFWVSPAQASSGGDASLQLHFAAVLALTVGCAWAGLLAAGIFRSAVAGLAVVIAVPVLIAPAVRTLFGGSVDRPLDGLPERLESVLLVPWPPGVDHWVSTGVQLASQPVGPALVLSLAVLLLAYLVAAVRSRAR